MIKKSLRTAALAIAAMAAFSMMSQDANAQCAYGGGGGVSLNIGGGGLGFGYSNFQNYGGFGGYYGGFNRGISIQSYRPSYYRVPNNFNYYSGRNVRYSNQFNFTPSRHHGGGHRHGHGGHGRR